MKLSTRNVSLSSLLAAIVFVGCSRSPRSANAEPARATAITQNLSKRPGAPLWNLESVGPVNEAWKTKSFDVPTHGKLIVIGWAVDQDAKTAAGGVEITFDGVPYSTEYRKPRPDVASTFGATGYTNSGYALAI